MDSFVRTYGMKLLTAPTVSINISETAWEPVTELDYLNRRYRVVGSIHAASISLDEKEIIRPNYTVIQVEERFNCGTESWYSSRLLVGRLIDVENQTLPFTAYHGSQGLWCTKCWADDMYGNGTGSIQLPSYMHGPYYKTLRYIPSCSHCGCTYKPYDPVNLAPLTSGEAWIFSSVLSPSLQRVVESLWAAHGVYTVMRCRSEEVSINPELMQQIEALAI